MIYYRFEWRDKRLICRGSSCIACFLRCAAAMLGLPIGSALLDPVVVVVVAALSLFNLVSCLKVIGQVAATRYAKDSVLGYLQPSIAMLNKGLVALFGPWRGNARRSGDLSVRASGLC